MGAPEPPPEAGGHAGIVHRDRYHHHLSAHQDDRVEVENPVAGVMLQRIGNCRIGAEIEVGIGLEGALFGRYGSTSARRR